MDTLGYTIALVGGSTRSPTLCMKLSVSIKVTFLSTVAFSTSRPKVQKMVRQKLRLKTILWALDIIGIFKHTQTYLNNSSATANDLFECV